MGPSFDPSSPRSRPSVLRLLIALLLLAVGAIGGNLHTPPVNAASAQTVAASLATDETPPAHLGERHTARRTARRSRRRPRTARVERARARARRIRDRWRAPLSVFAHAAPSWRGPPPALS